MNGPHMQEGMATHEHEGPATTDADLRLVRLYAAVARRDGHPGHLARLKAICLASIDLLPVSGAGVMLMADRAHQGTLYATDDIIARLEDLQNAAAEGPCLDSYILGRPVLEPDLAGAGRHKWPLLAASAVEVGINALFSFPLQIDGASIGAFDLYRTSIAALTDEQVDDARLLAAMATREVLGLQAEMEPGTLPPLIADLSDDRAVIEQATGMVAAQLGADITRAAHRLREVAMDEGRSLAELARDVTTRTIRMS